MAPAVVSIVSKKKSGKTTLIEKLIPALRRKGYRVGTVKHDTHGFDIDHQGKDSWRHKQAGADAVVVSFAKKISLIKDVAQEMSLDQIVTELFSDMDIVITEGYKRADKPQIEVYRSAVHSMPLHSKEEKNTLVAVMSDVPLDLGVPRFDINDILALADFIEDVFIKERS